MLKRITWVLLAVSVLLPSAEPATGFSKIASGFDQYSCQILNDAGILDIVADPKRSFLYVFHVKVPFGSTSGESLIDRLDGYGNDAVTYDKGNIVMTGFFGQGCIEIGNNSSLIVCDMNFKIVDSMIVGGPILRKYDQNLNYIGWWAYPAGAHWFEGGGNCHVSLAADKNGNIYFGLQSTLDKIYKFQDNGSFIRSWGTHGNRDGQFDRLVAIAVDDKTETLFAVDSAKRVQKFKLNGQYVGTFTHTGDTPEDMTFDPRHQEIFISDGAKITRYTEKGEKIGSIVPAGGAQKLAYNQMLGKGLLYATQKNKKITVWERNEK